MGHVNAVCPEVNWLYDKNGSFKKENFDISDSITCIIGYINMIKKSRLIWFFKIFNLYFTYHVLHDKGLFLLMDGRMVSSSIFISIYFFFSFIFLIFLLIMVETMVNYEPIVEILIDIFGEYKFHNEYSGQISFSCPVCSYEIKCLDHLDGKGNLEINYKLGVYKCW